MIKTRGLIVGSPQLSIKCNSLSFYLKPNLNQLVLFLVKIFNLRTANDRELLSDPMRASDIIDKELSSSVAS